MLRDVPDMSIDSPELLTFAMTKPAPGWTAIWFGPPPPDLPSLIFLNSPVRRSTRRAYTLSSTWPFAYTTSGSVLVVQCSPRIRSIHLRMRCEPAWILARLERVREAERAPQGIEEERVDVEPMCAYQQ
jgi:hypothetical protein